MASIVLPMLGGGGELSLLQGGYSCRKGTLSGSHATVGTEYFSAAKTAGGGGDNGSITVTITCTKAFKGALMFRANPQGYSWTSTLTVSGTAGITTTSLNSENFEMAVGETIKLTISSNAEQSAIAFAVAVLT